MDSLGQFLRQYPQDLDGWYVLGEARFHTAQLTGVEPESISAAFDRVVEGDSGLVPALIHPVEVALVMRDSVRFRRYLPVIARSAPARAEGLRTIAGVVWGPLPPDSAVRVIRGFEIGGFFQALQAAYRDEKAASDSIVARFEWAADVVPAARCCA